MWSRPECVCIIRMCSGVKFVCIIRVCVSELQTYAWLYYSYAYKRYVWQYYSMLGDRSVITFHRSLQHGMRRPSPNRLRGRKAWTRCGPSPPES